MEDKKLIFFDIDGTLVDSNTHIVPASTIKALQLLRKKGHTLCICSGRSLISLKEGEFEKLIDWDIYVCNNGQAIYNHDFQPLQLTCIPSDIVHACLHKAEELNSPLFIMGESNRLTTEPNTYVIESTEYFKEIIPPVLPYDESFVLMMIAYGPMGYDYQEYRDIEGIEVIPGPSTYADIILKGFHKHLGIQFVLDYFNKSEYIAFGDSLNDVEMLENATIGVAMGNGFDEVKDVADFVTTEVWNDGIYVALQKLNLI